ncbi:MAG TPA: carbohydrate ABC transporter permease [Chthonomonadaceae bacterium]|nr:carbohydrate ABC transporter permease [Chthonomonadaceae bacterium]
MRERAMGGYRLRGRLAAALTLLIMCLGAWVMVYPYLYAVGNSLKTRAEFTADKQSLTPPRLRPGKLAERYLLGRPDPEHEKLMQEWPPLRNYREAIIYGGIDRFLCNSFLYALVTTAGSLLFSILAAYAFARMRFPGRDFLFGMLLTTMMIPSVVTLIPQFLVIRSLHLVDHPLGVVLPSFVSAFGIFLLRQFFLNIPAELENAARIDGCSRWGILWRILVPLSKPALITLGLFTFMGAWNAFEWPLVVLSNENLYPLTVGLALFRDQNTQDWPRILAAGVMGSLPLLLLFYAAQRFLTQGISLSGMKS